VKRMYVLPEHRGPVHVQRVPGDPAVRHVRGPRDERLLREEAVTAGLADLR
jgi:hypothetical protein